MQLNELMDDGFKVVEAWKPEQAGIAIKNQWVVVRGTKLTLLLFYKGKLAGMGNCVDYDGDGFMKWEGDFPKASRWYAGQILLNKIEGLQISDAIEGVDVV